MKLKWVLETHEVLIHRYGGAQGVRDMNLLHSALFRPYATFDGVDLYATPVEKAAAILESIITDHPFIDGNKRTGYILMRSILILNDMDIFASQADKYKFVIEVTEGKHSIDSIKEWIEQHLVH
jgi:death on curing protein